VSENYLGLQGIEFVEFASREPDRLHRLFLEFGFSRTRALGDDVDYYCQNDIHFLLNRRPRSFGAKFSEAHGPSLCSMGWRVSNAGRALEIAVSRGARKATGDYRRGGVPIPAIYGIGDSLIYFIDGSKESGPYNEMGFEPLERPDLVAEKGFLAIDHLTNNVEQGQMKYWADYYKNIFGFEEIRYFDIRGAKTGLVSYALRSPDGSFCIPINEGTESKSQINEFLEEYRGPGVQHLAFVTRDIVSSLSALNGTSIKTLDIDEEYYNEVFGRVPNVTEDHATLKAMSILVDGDENGYLLQIFTKNLIGPIFIEIIQRKNHFSFGEGNFGALFRSIERDQQSRGKL